MNATTELVCISCHRPFGGAVSYCPYCGTAQPVKGVRRPDQPVLTVANPSELTLAPQDTSPAITDDERADDVLWEQRERARDEALWKKVCDEDTLEAYQGYLETDIYAKRYAGEVEKRVNTLKARIDSSTPEPEPEPPKQPAVSSLAEAPVAPPRKWWRFALVGVALVMAFIIWANLGGDDKMSKVPGQDDEIAELMRLAGDDIRNDRLGNPVDNNALEKYRRILSMQPEHSEALQGVKNVAARYLELQEQAVKQGKPVEARKYLDLAVSLDPTIAANPPQNEPVTITPEMAQRQEDERRCVALIETGWKSLGQKPGSDYNQAIDQVREAQSILPDCPGAAELLKHASDQRDFVTTEQPKKERADLVGREKCMPMVTQGNQAMQARRYEWALRYANNARNIYAQCPGVELLEQEANAAIASAGANADADKRNQCESLVNTGEDALLRRDYAGAVRNATRAIQVYPGCTGAGDLENSAKAAMCAQFVTNGQDAYRSGQYSQALNFSRRAISTYARCSGAESLEREALLAMNAAKDQTDKGNQEKARVRCEALVDAGRDALQSASYDQAINSARRAKQAYSQCPEADALERDALAAKRKAREGTTIF